jgi:CRISPR type I-E-associated protein CasB/Cse2
VTPTEQYIEVLTHLKSGDLGLLREHAGLGLDESVGAFDLFAGLWWPLRAKNQRAPRRGVAWLIAKLYAFRPIEHSPGQTIAYQLGRCRPAGKAEVGTFEKRFDRLLSLPISKIEPGLRWALDLLAPKALKLDWVELTDDLSLWERDSKRMKWAKEFLKTSKEDFHAD